YTTLFRSDEDVGPKRVLALQPTQGPQLAVAQIVGRPRPILHPVDADRLLHEIDLVPLQVDQLARAQAVPEGDQDRGGIAVTIAAVLAGDRHQPLDLGLGEVFPRTPRANCPTFRPRSPGLDHPFSRVVLIPASITCPSNRRMWDSGQYSFRRVESGCFPLCWHGMP